MTRKARIENGIAQEILDTDPFPLFHPALVWVECGTEVMEGWTYNGQTFAAPVIPPAPDRTPENIAALWQAAHDYEYAEISGSAIGLLALGMAQAKPKCIAVEGWIGSIWTLYYQRKAQITTNMDPSMLDFSGCGPIPYTVPELMAELAIS